MTLRDKLNKAKDELNLVMDEQASLASIEDWSDEQLKRFDELEAERLSYVDSIASLEEQVQKREAALNRKADLERGRGVKTQTTGEKLAFGRESVERDPKRGFSDVKEFLCEVAKATKSNTIDNKGLQFLAVGSDEQSGYSNPHGGFLVPEALVGGMITTPQEADPIASRVSHFPMTAPSVKFTARTDKNHTSSVSGGFQVYRREESGTFTSSRMEMEKVGFTANELTGAAFATREIMDDSPISIASLIASGMREEFAASLINERLWGTGAGEYEGIMNCPSLITVAKQGGQAADTLDEENIIKMRMRAWRYGNCIWIVNHDCYGELSKLSRATTGGNSDAILFTPENGIDVPPTLLGRPVFFTEFASKLGDVGDIILADWSQYLEGTLQPMRQESSSHVRFLQNEETFKFYTRNDGRTLWRSVYTPHKGANTLSPFVTLAERA